MERSRGDPFRKKCIARRCLRSPRSREITTRKVARRGGGGCYRLAFNAVKKKCEPSPLSDKASLRSLGHQFIPEVLRASRNCCNRTEMVLPHQIVMSILLYSTRSTLKPTVGIVVTTSLRWSLYCIEENTRHVRFESNRRKRGGAKQVC